MNGKIILASVLGSTVNIPGAQGVCAARTVARKRGAWRHGRDNDAFFHGARRRGLRSRAALKLESIDDRDKLFLDARVVVDLGAAPGGWSQVARRALAPTSRVVALDLLEMEPIPGVEFIHGDFLHPDVLARIESSVGRRAADLVMSDMAPNLSGMRVHDQMRWRDLAESAARFADVVLKPGGVFLVKLFQGEETESYLRMLRERFASVAVRKPAGSRRQSTETYALARGSGSPDRNDRTSAGTSVPSDHGHRTAGHRRSSTPSRHRGD